MWGEEVIFLSRLNKETASQRDQIHKLEIRNSILECYDRCHFWLGSLKTNNTDDIMQRPLPGIAGGWYREYEGGVIMWGENHMAHAISTHAFNRFTPEMGFPVKDECGEDTFPTSLWHFCEFTDAMMFITRVQEKIEVKAILGPIFRKLQGNPFLLGFPITEVVYDSQVYSPLPPSMFSSISQQSFLVSTCTFWWRRNLLE